MPRVLAVPLLITLNLVRIQGCFVMPDICKVHSDPYLCSNRASTHEIAQYVVLSTITYADPQQIAPIMPPTYGARHKRVVCTALFGNRMHDHCQLAGHVLQHAQSLIDNKSSLGDAMVSRATETGSAKQIKCYMNSLHCLNTVVTRSFTSSSPTISDPTIHEHPTRRYELLKG